MRLDNTDKFAISIYFFCAYFKLLIPGQETHPQEQRQADLSILCRCISGSLRS